MKPQAKIRASETKGHWFSHASEGMNLCGLEPGPEEEKAQQRLGERLAFLPKVLSQYESFPVQHFQLHT